MHYEIEAFAPDKYGRHAWGGVTFGGMLPQHVLHAEHPAKYQTQEEVRTALDRARRVVGYELRMVRVGGDERRPVEL